MSLTAMWVHGNTVVPENPEKNLTRNVILGFGIDTALREGTGCWFHAAPPTPVFLRDRRPQLLRVIILFRSGPGGRLADVHLFDSSSRVETFDTGAPGAFTGHPAADFLTQSPRNTFELAAPREISFGLGISFHFAADVGSPQPVLVGAVGADWQFLD
jgi:hypothetical protein